MVYVLGDCDDRDDRDDAESHDYADDHEDGNCLNYCLSVRHGRPTPPTCKKLQGCWPKAGRPIAHGDFCEPSFLVTPGGQMVNTSPPRERF